MLNNEHRHAPLEKSKNPFTCGISGRTYTALEAKERVSFLARALSKDLGFEVNKGTEWDKVIGLYALNTVSYCTFCTQLLRAVGHRSPRALLCEHG
jgi:ribosome assembly protein SQT1